VGNLKTVEALVYDPYQELWFRQILTNGGRGAIEPLVGRSGWDGGALALEGRLWLFGDRAEIGVRIVKESDDGYSEIWEEKLIGNIIRQVFEFRYRRVLEPKKKG
jgi:hypothetical protein